MEKLGFIALSISCVFLIIGFEYRGREVRELEIRNESLVSENQSLSSEIKRLEKPEPVRNCPLCNSSEIVVDYDYAFGFCVMCTDCYLHTGRYETEYEAREAWNSLYKKEDF